MINCGWHVRHQEGSVACPRLPTDTQCSSDSASRGWCQSPSPVLWLQSRSTSLALFFFFFPCTESLIMFQGSNLTEFWGTLWWERQCANVQLADLADQRFCWASLLVYYFLSIWNVDNEEMPQWWATRWGGGEDGARVGDFSCGKWCIFGPVLSFTSSKGHIQYPLQLTVLSVIVISCVLTVLLGFISCVLPFLWSMVAL